MPAHPHHIRVFALTVGDDYVQEFGTGDESLDNYLLRELQSLYVLKKMETLEGRRALLLVHTEFDPGRAYEQIQLSPDTEMPGIEEALAEVERSFDSGFEPGIHIYEALESKDVDGAMEAFKDGLGHFQLAMGNLRKLLDEGGLRGK